MLYPKELFGPNELVTKENIRQYETRQKKLYQKCEELYPDFWKKNLRERMEIKNKVKEEFLL